MDINALIAEAASPLWGWPTIVLLFAIGFRLIFGLSGRIIRLFHKEKY